MTMKNNNANKKLVIIGLDGATFDVLDTYVEKGVLPNIERMMRNGARGELESAIPPVTGPSWVSFMTGVGPGKHGIFDFVRRMDGSVKRQAITYRDIRTRTLWSLLDEAGKSVGVVNLPITYPAPEVKGFVIPGLLTPSAEGEFGHPVGIMDEVRSAVGEYVLDVWWQNYGEAGVERFLDELLYCTEQRIKTFEYLMKTRQWDVFMGVFIGTDRIQHYLWKYIHPENLEGLSERERLISEKIADYFRRIDRFFGDILEGLGDKGDILVMSDHGFGSLKKKMFINRWLRENGFLSVDDKKKKSMGIKKSILSIVRPVVKAIDVFELRKKLGLQQKLLGRMSAYDFLDCIEWDKTLAYSASNTEQGIYINLKGREPQGVVSSGEEYERLRSEIMEKLRDLVEPETGEKVVSRMYRREDLYQGPFASDSPDIVLFLKDGQWLIDVQLGEDIYEDAGWHTGYGTHRLEGILMAYGPSIKRGVNVKGARIVDIASTVLYQQGLPVPEEMDGRPLTDIFDDAFLEKRPMVYSTGSHGLAGDNGGSRLSETEQKEVEEKLKGLGYL